MTRDEYIEECQALIDSFDDHVTQEDVVTTLRMIADRIEAEGLDANEPEFAPGECEGHACCTAKLHVHGCFADWDGSRCDDPTDHTDGSTT